MNSLRARRKFLGVVVCMRDVGADGQRVDVLYVHEPAGPGHLVGGGGRILHGQFHFVRAGATDAVRVAQPAALEAAAARQPVHRVQQRVVHHRHPAAPGLRRQPQGVCPHCACLCITRVLLSLSFERWLVCVCVRAPLVHVAVLSLSRPRRTRISRALSSARRSHLLFSRGSLIAASTVAM